MNIPIYYDPMLAKLVAYGKDRKEAIDRLLRAISDYKIVGVKNTLNFGKFVLNHPDFINGTFDTNFVGKNYKPEYLLSESTEEMEIAALLAEHLYETKSKLNATVNQTTQISNRPSNWVKNRSSYRD